VQLGVGQRAHVRLFVGEGLVARTRAVLHK
jgi:hypothetical protein